MPCKQVCGTVLCLLAFSCLKGEGSQSEQSVLHSRDSGIFLPSMIRMQLLFKFCFLFSVCLTVLHTFVFYYFSFTSFFKRVLRLSNCSIFLKPSCCRMRWCWLNSFYSMGKSVNKIKNEPFWIQRPISRLFLLQMEGRQERTAKLWKLQMAFLNLRWRGLRGEPFFSN